MEYYRPTSVEDAVQILGRSPGAACMAGGTDLVVAMRSHKRGPHAIVDLSGLGLDTWIFDDASNRPAKVKTQGTKKAGNDEQRLGPGWRIGATVTMAVLKTLEDEDNLGVGLLADAASQVGATQIQNRATAGGNLCNGSPAADAVCAMVALDALIEIAGPTGAETMPIGKFLLGPGRVNLEPGQFLTGIFVPAHDMKKSSVALQEYRKVGSRTSLVIAVAGLAARTVLDKGKVVESRLALSSVAPTCIRATEAEAYLTGGPLSPDRIREASHLAREEARPITDLRATDQYRKEMVSALVTDHLTRAAALAQ
ncbi:MAG: xanthine dehydrogenase family protein subunit M [Deltaproteobacteria bacterium]|nr:xanthine dehydrogenase family protein subunit M [Deltaproteobacteria bacterium]